MSAHEHEYQVFRHLPGQQTSLRLWLSLARPHIVWTIGGVTYYCWGEDEEDA